MLIQISQWACNSERIICHHKIDVGQWLLSYLPRLGGGMRLLIDIPAGGELFDNLVTHINNAENAFRRWDSKSVFANC